MDVAQTQPLFSGSQSTEIAKPQKALSSDFETFLKMLTVQMQNQDPLNPVDSADYAVQLATFSSVEQQVLTNDLLSALSAQLTGGGIGALGQWVGMEVRGGNSAPFVGTKVEMSVPVTEGADRRILVVRDTDGQTITRLDIPLNETEYVWFGDLSGGGTAPQQNYTYSVEAYQNGEMLNAADASVYAAVKEARIESGKTQLVLDGGAVLSPEKVTALRSPET